MVVEIRPAEGLECELIREIHVELRPPLREHCAAEEFLLAWVEGVAVGCAATTAHAEGIYFHGLAVRKDWQRRGIGGLLMQARLDAAKQVGSAAYAIALVMLWNSRCFRKHGFMPVNVRRCRRRQHSSGN